MSSVALLLGLLVVAYLGSNLMGEGRAGYRLPSGAEYLLFGIAMGPYALGLVERSTLSSFEPLSVVGTAWLTLVIGADYGFHEDRRVAVRGLVLGLLLAAATALGVLFAVYTLLSRVPLLPGADVRLVAAGAALVSCETTRHAVRWVAGRYGTEGPLSRLVGDLSDADDLVPIIGIALFFPALSSEDLAIQLPFHVWGALTPLLGVVLGGTAAALLRSEPRASEGWGVIIGATLLATGIAWRLGLAPQAATFALGLTLSVTSRHGKELRAMISGTEQAVLLPTLVLAGAEVEVSAPMGLAAGLAAVVLVRILVRRLFAPVLVSAAGAPKASEGALSVGLVSTGALSITVALAFSSRFPGPSGDAVLALGVLLALAGELVGPRSLKRALVLAGEVKEARSEAEPPAEPVVPRTEVPS
ncbi:MAG TPA: potassium transporter Kef [Polyangiaceae bacterium]|nr:potassium transporter Kef [Polyangiaceae bacterium]